MNFKLTPKKIIASIVLPSILFILFSYIIDIPRRNDLPGIIVRLSLSHNATPIVARHVVLFVIEIIILYILISLFQKKQ